jgi:predicted DNA-binding protein (MmcQ/YjbR family)
LKVCREFWRRELPDVVAALYERHRWSQTAATVSNMDLEQFREHCLRKPGASEGTPFGPDVLVFKVGGKMFALAALDEVPARVNLKCDPDLALDLRDRFDQVTPGYHMNKRHWNTVEIESGVPDGELRRMIDHSYELVVRSLPVPKVKIAARSRQNLTSTLRGRR